MNDHSQRLIGRVLNTIELYENGKVTIRELEMNIEGVCNALEDKEVANWCKGLVSKINDAIHLYNENDGRQFLLQELKVFKGCIKK